MYKNNSFAFFRYRNIEFCCHAQSYTYFDKDRACRTQYIASANRTETNADMLSCVDTTSNMGCLKPPKHGERCVLNHYNSRLSVVVRTFKAAVTRVLTNQLRTQCIASLPIWQSRFHEHVVRDSRDYENINAYITENPLRWDKDVFNQQSTS